MSFPFFFSDVRLSTRIAGAAVLVFALAAPELCSAAEKTFGGNYSVQLPAGWSGELQEDKSLIGQNADGITFGFKAYPSDISPEEYMAKALGNTEKRAGYKLIEKGPVKSSGGRKAQLLRYQTDGKNGPEIAVKYYFQLVDKEVVVLLFSWVASAITKSPKADIETIFDSVKVATAAGKDDSWLNSDANPAASPGGKAAPPASTSPTTRGTPVTFATNCSVEIPAGWTGKAVGTHLEGKGPGGVILDGFSVQGAMALDDAVAELTTVFEKTFKGYKLLDTAHVFTAAGAKGTVVLYRHTGKTGPQSELGLCAVIKAADNQIVTLRFAASNTPKLEDSLLNAVQAIYKSLKITK